MGLARSCRSVEVSHLKRIHTSPSCSQVLPPWDLYFSALACLKPLTPGCRTIKMTDHAVDHGIENVLAINHPDSDAWIESAFASR